MFDNYKLAVDNGGPRNVKVEERRAPTDESIRLLNEMKHKLTKEIVAEYTFSDNIVNGAIVMFHHEVRTNAYRMVIKFTLNGDEYYEEEVISASEIMKLDVHQILIKFCKAIADQISFKMVEKLINREGGMEHLGGNDLDFLIREKNRYGR